MGRRGTGGAGLAKIKATPPPMAPALFDEFRKGLGKSARGFEAPQRCADAVQAAATLPFAEGLKRERALFAGLMQGTQSKAQIHVFFSEREVTKIPDVPKETPVTPITSAPGLERRQRRYINARDDAVAIILLINALFRVNAPF